MGHIVKLANLLCSATGISNSLLTTCMVANSLQLMVGGDENKVDGAIALILRREAESHYLHPFL